MRYYRAHFGSEYGNLFRNSPTFIWGDNILIKNYKPKHYPICINNNFNSRKRSFTKKYLTQTFSNIRKNRRKHRYDRL